MEGDDINSLIDSFDTLPKYLNRHEALLGELQCLHDNGDNWESTQSFKSAAILIAEDFKLDTTVLDGKLLKKRKHVKV